MTNFVTIFWHGICLSKKCAMVQFGHGTRIALAKNVPSFFVAGGMNLARRGMVARVGMEIALAKIMPSFFGTILARGGGGGAARLARKLLEQKTCQVFLRIGTNSDLAKIVPSFRRQVGTKIARGRWRRVGMVFAKAKGMPIMKKAESTKMYNRLIFKLFLQVAVGYRDC